MFVKFFIERPIFAGVCALLIVLAGGVSLPGLPIAQYPQLAPAQVQVTASYVGASAELVEATVTTPLEQQINGAQGMRYISSVSTNGGASVITVTFDVTRDPDLATFDVQNRVNQATALLPIEVKQTGVTVVKTSTQFVLALALLDDSGAHDAVFLSNYATVYLIDALKRVPGVADVRIFGERKYAMRVWLDPARLAGRGLSAADVVAALAEQNLSVASGQLGQPPAPPGQTYQLSVLTHGRLADPAEFDRVVLKSSPDGTLVRLQDVGHAALGAEDYTSAVQYNGHTGVGIGVTQLPDANALDVGRGVLAALAELRDRFPPGVRYETAFDTTTFVRASIVDVVVTLAVAIGLVLLVMFLFLATLRATLIPALTIPVSLVGTFAFVRAFGFSINTLTIFGLVLATALVVDDAIVVIENVQRQMVERGLVGREAAMAAMGEVAGPVIATSLVLIAVFVPAAFFPGTTGRIYRQFSLTIAFSVAISTFNALTLTPALSALILRRGQGKFAARVDRVTDRVRDAYGRLLERLLRRRSLMGVLFAGMLVLTVIVYRSVPTGFVPEEDQGYLIVATQGPDGSSLEQTQRALEAVDGVLHGQDEVASTFAIAGFSLSGSLANQGTTFVLLKPYDQRKGAAHGAQAVVDRIRGPLFAIPGANAFALLPPAVQGIGNYGGFQLEILDRTSGPPGELAAATASLVARGNGDPGLRGLFTQFTADAPQLILDVDREKSKRLGLRLDAVFGALQGYVGSQYVNDFTLGSRAYRVYVQAEAAQRAEPGQLAGLYARADTGAMVPLGAVVRMRDGTAPQLINHYDLFRSAEIDGSPAPGTSTGEALRRMQALSGQVLPANMSAAWTGLSLEQQSEGSAAATLFALGLLVVFLVLAAQYESFSLPFVVLLAVPLAVLGALLGEKLRGLPNDLFVQVGLLMLVGLASKNAILIVEFARRRRTDGLSIVDAVIDAARVRLRPILMTSFAFILGVLPLVLATGPGSAGRRALGTAVFGGMLVSTLLNLALIPPLYAIVETLRERRGRNRAPVA